MDITIIPCITYRDGYYNHNNVLHIEMDITIITCITYRDGYYNHNMYYT